MLKRWHDGNTQDAAARQIIPSRWNGRHPAKYSLHGTKWCGTRYFRLNSLLNLKYRVLFADQRMQAFRPGEQTAVLELSTVCLGWNTRTVVQANVAWVRRLRGEIRKFGCEGKHWERLAHSWDMLPG